MAPSNDVWIALAKNEMITFDIVQHQEEPWTLRCTVELCVIGFCAGMLFCMRNHLRF
jgi:hypothetical protein